MHSFKDTEGRAWTIGIHVLAVKRVRALAEVDLYALMDGSFEALGRLTEDPCKLVDVLYVLCRDEAERRGLTDEDFGRSLGGDSLQQAIEAFVAELVDFCPDPRRREALARMMETGKSLQTRMAAKMMGELDRLDLDDVERRLIDSYGNSRASSGSTPGPSRSGN